MPRQSGPRWVCATCGVEMSALEATRQLLNRAKTLLLQAKKDLEK